MLNSEITVTYFQAILIVIIIIIFLYSIMPEKISLAVLQSQLEDCKYSIRMLQKAILYKQGKIQ